MAAHSEAVAAYAALEEYLGKCARDVVSSDMDPLVAPTGVTSLSLIHPSVIMGRVCMADFQACRPI